MTTAAPLLEARGIVKRFGPLLANDVAEFAVQPGEVMALLGENGAGKSTLCKILYGYYRPDAGTIRVAGAAAVIASPSDARRLGIGMVFQNFSLIPALTVLGKCRAVPRRFAVVDRPGRIALPHAAAGRAVAPDRRSASAGEPPRGRRSSEGRNPEAAAGRRARSDSRRAHQGAGAARDRRPVPHDRRASQAKVTGWCS